MLGTQDFMVGKLWATHNFSYTTALLSSAYCSMVCFVNIYLLDNYSTSPALKQPGPVSIGARLMPKGWELVGTGSLAVPGILIKFLKRPPHGKLKLANSCWQTRVGKPKLVCVNGTKTGGKHVCKLLASNRNVFADCFYAIHTHQLEFANTSLPTLVCRVKVA